MTGIDFGTFMRIAYDALCCDNREIKAFDRKSSKAKVNSQGHTIAPYYRKEWKRQYKKH